MFNLRVYLWYLNLFLLSASENKAAPCFKYIEDVCKKVTYNKGARHVDGKFKRWTEFPNNITYYNYKYNF